jgi:hypothetical protein
LYAALSVIFPIIKEIADIPDVEIIQPPEVYIDIDNPARSIEANLHPGIGIGDIYIQFEAVQPPSSKAPSQSIIELPPDRVFWFGLSIFGAGNCRSDVIHCIILLRLTEKSDNPKKEPENDDCPYNNPKKLHETSLRPP